MNNVSDKVIDFALNVIAWPLLLFEKINSKLIKAILFVPMLFAMLINLFIGGAFALPILFIGVLINMFELTVLNK